MCVLLEAAGPAAINAAALTPYALESVGSRDLYHQGIEEIEKALVNAFKEDDPRFIEIQCAIHHAFAPGVYLRTIKMPAGSVIVGAEHKTEHFNICLEGHAQVMIDGIIEEIIAPCVFVSKPGIRKVLYIVEDTTWTTVHATELTDPEEIERNITVKTDTMKNRKAA